MHVMHGLDNHVSVDLITSQSPGTIFQTLNTGALNFRVKPTMMHTPKSLRDVWFCHFASGCYDGLTDAVGATFLQLS